MRAALALLTILPVGTIRHAPGRSALLAFPLVGLVIGAIWTAVGAGVGLWLGPLVGAAVVIMVDAIVTGGLHLDGVADVGDVIGSRRRGAEALAVARDPHVGALGVVALVSVMLVRFALITMVLTQASSTAAAGPHPAWLLLAVPTVGRMAMVAALASSPAAEGSSTTPLIEAAGSLTLIAGLCTSGIVLFAVGAGPWDIAGILTSTIGVGALGVAWWNRRTGATSGDLIGALGLLAEISALAVLS